MSSLQVANVFFESTANTRLQYDGAGGMAIFAGGTNAITVNATSIAVANTFSVGGNSVNPFGGLKNRVINGSFDIWQRGTTYSLTTTSTCGSADRWAVNQFTSANGVANQVASGLTGFQYALKIGRTPGATTTGSIEAVQALETVNSIPLQGQQVTISFWAKVGANFTSSNSIYVAVVSGTGTDQSVSIIAGGWTNYNAFINQVAVLSSTWARFSYTGTVPSNATQVGIRFGYYAPSGTAGADDNFYITGVQLEQGNVATPFERRPYGMELALCQRYYQIMNGQIDTAQNGTSYSYATWFYKTTMRAIPTVTQTGTAIGGQNSVTADMVQWYATNAALRISTATATAEL